MLEVFFDTLKRRKDEGRLFGRDAEVELILSVYKQTLQDKSPKAIFVHGYSGSGKSCLVERTLAGNSYNANNSKSNQSSNSSNSNNHTSTHNNNEVPIFVSGKYDQLRSARPYSALIDACRSLCLFLGTTPDGHQQQHDDGSSLVPPVIHESALRDKKLQATSFLEKALENDVNLLYGLIPELAQLLPNLDTDTVVVSTPPDHLQFDRLKHALQTFFTGVSKVFPVVLFIDDLQWADAASMHIYASLLAESCTVEQFVLVGAYRDNELKASHPLVESIQTLEALPCSTKIHVTDLSPESLNVFVADLLKYEDNPSVTESFSANVHQRTLGNIFFVLQFLEMLVTHDMLQYSLLDLKWHWDEKKLRNKTNSTDNVVDLVIQKMRRLPQKSSLAMLIASQLGARFNMKIVFFMVELFGTFAAAQGEAESALLVERMAKQNPLKDDNVTPEVMAIFEIPLKDGFIVPSASERWYRFSHDRIQQGAAGLTDEQMDLNMLRYRMGRILLAISKDEGRVPWVTLKAADLLNLSSADLVVTEAEILDLIHVNLEAAKISSTQSAFCAAAEYLAKCRSLQGDDKWQEGGGGGDKYNLTLEIYTMSAEMEFCRGSSSNCRFMVEEIRQHVKCLKDKLYATYILVKSLGSEAMYDDSIDLAYEALNQAGFTMPTGGADLKDVKAIFSRCLKKLKEVSNVDILHLKEDQLDESREFCIKILISLILFTWHANRKMDHDVVGCTLLLNTLENGLSEYSGIGFAIFGACSNVHMEIEVAKRMYMLASHPMVKQRFTGKEIEGATICVTYATSGHLCLPFAMAADEFMGGYRSAMKAGLVEWAIADSGLYLMVYYMSGLPLSVFATDAWVFIEQMKQYKNHIHRPLCELYLQCALNLMGKGNEDPLVLHGGAALKDYNVSKIMDGSLPNFPVQVGWYAQLMLAYYLGNYDLAVDMATKHEECNAAEWPLAWSVPHPFFRGLAYLALARQLQGQHKKKSDRDRFALFANKKRCKTSGLLKRAKTQVDLVRTYVKHEMINSFHMLKILEAELLSLEPKATYSDVRHAYQLAIRVSARAGFCQDAALGSERFAMYLCERNETEEAGFFFSRAMELYEQWGALALVARLERERKEYLQRVPTPMFLPSKIKLRSSLVRAKSRQAVSETNSRDLELILTDDEDILAPGSSKRVPK